MLWRLSFILFVYFESVSNVPMIVYNNAWFNSANLFSQQTTIYPVFSMDACACQCYVDSLCVTGTFIDHNKTCVLSNAHPKPEQVLLILDDPSSVFSFLNKTTVVYPNNLTTTIEWLFDGDFTDVYGRFNGVLATNNGTSITNNDTLWVSPGYAGYGSAVNFPANIYSVVNYSLSLTTTSFTISAWIWISTNFTLQNSEYFSLFSHCKPINVNDNCFHAVVTAGYLHLGFFGDDLIGNTTLYSMQWYHVAYVYDRSASLQFVYLSGILDGSRAPNYLYTGNASQIVLGPIPSFDPTTYHRGFIDRLTFVSRVKNASELLDEATLVAYYAFDGSYVDSGPNNINKINSISTNFDSDGQLNQALLINLKNSSYFQTIGFYYLGQANYPYSFSLWIYPFVNHGTILQVSSPNGWCVPMIGFDSGGYLTIQTLSVNGIYSTSFTNTTLQLNQWCHISMTYSTMNGIRLFVNGLLVGANIAYNDYSASGELNTITIGTSLQTDICAVNRTKIVTSQFEGKIDELRIFSRELSKTEVQQLAVVY